MSTPFAQVFRIAVKANSTASMVHDMFAKRLRLERVLMRVDGVEHNQQALDPSGRVEVHSDVVVAIFEPGKLTVTNTNDNDKAVEICVQGVLMSATDPWDPHPWVDRQNHARAANETIGQTDDQAYATFAKWHVRDIAANGLVFSSEIYWQRVSAPGPAATGKRPLRSSATRSPGSTTTRFASRLRLTEWPVMIS